MNDPTNNWEDLFEQLPLEPTAREVHRQQLKIQTLDAFDSSQQAPVSDLKRIGQTLMKYKIPQLAVAVVAIVVAVSAFNFSENAFAIENVVAKLVNATSARWESVIDLGSLGKHTIKTAVIPGRTRQEDENGAVTILDWKSGQALSLSPDSKSAIRMNMGQDSPELDSFNVFQTMRDSLAGLLESGGLDNVESLGKKTIDGRELAGYRFDDEVKMTIWVDPNTEVAIQIEITIGTGLNVVMKNYEADFPVDQALFSLDIPDGYQKTEVNLPTTSPSEAEFIRSLKLSCECGDGTFPPGLDIVSTANVSVDVNVHLMKSMELAPTGVTGKQLEELTRASMGLMFGYFMAVDSEHDAHYAGAKVKLGEKDRPIFWYKPEDSDQYRIIFADLTVKQADSAPNVDGAVKLSL